MSPRSRPLLAIAFLVGAGLVAALYFARRAPTTPVDPGVGLGTDSRPASLATEVDTSKATASGAGAKGERTAVPASALRGFDAEYTAALASFTGRLVTHDRQPASDRRVQLLRFDAQSILHDKLTLDPSTTCEPSLDDGEATTGADGRFTIQGTLPRACYLLLAAAGAEDQTHVIVERSPGPGETVDLGDIELEWAATLTGSIVDSSEKPVAGAYIRAIDLPGIVSGAVRFELFAPGEAVIVGQGRETTVVELPEWIEKRIAQLPMAFTKSDVEGKFRLAGVRAGANLFTVSASGLLAHLNPSLRLKPGQTKDLGVIRLGEGESVQGRVVDTLDKPVAGAEVLVAPKSLAAPIHFARRTPPSDKDGRFTLSGVPAGSVIAAARRDKTSAWILTEPQPAASDLVVKLPATHSLTLRFVSKKDLPIESPQIHLVRGPFGEAGLGMALFGIAPRVPLEGRTQQLEDGRIRITSLDAGHYELGVVAKGHALAELALDITADTENTIALDTEQGLVVRVQDQNGRPLSQVSIHCGQQPARSEIPLFAGRTASDGALVVKHGSAATKLTLNAQHPRYGVAFQEVGLPATEAKIVLLAPGDILGTVTEDGRPPKPGKWTIVAVATGRGGDMGPMPRLATPDLEGRFVIRGLVPGPYSLTSIPTLKSMRSLGSVVQFGMTASLDLGDEEERDAQVEVRSGSVTQARLELRKKQLDPNEPAGHVYGTVFVDDKPGTGLVVHGYANGRHRAVVDERGTFDLGRVPVGKTELHLTDPSADHGPLTGLMLSQLWQKDLEIKESGDHRIEILIRTSSIRGRVVTAVGAPAGGAILLITGRPTDGKEGNDDIHIPVGCDEKGRFEVARLPEGVYRVDVEQSEHGRGQLSGISVSSGSPVDGLELRLRATVSVRGKLDIKSLALGEHHGVYVSLVQEGGGEGRGRGRRLEELDSFGTFTIDGVMPGTYKLRIWAWGSNESREYEHSSPIVVGERGLDGLVVVPVEIKPGKAK